MKISETNVLEQLPILPNIYPVYQENLGQPPPFWKCLENSNLSLL